MPVPTDELDSDIYSNASSCLNEEDEGIARKPNIFQNFKTLPYSEKKTANDSVNYSNPITPRKEIYCDNMNNSITINSSWEVVEGSSIIIEVESSFKTDSITSKKNKAPILTETKPEIDILRNENRKSSESKTATFTSNTGFRKQGEEENKSMKNNEEKKGKDKPFMYNELNSEEDDYNSEEEISSHSIKENMSNNGSQWAPSKEINSVVPHSGESINPESSSQKTLEKEGGWTGSSDEKGAMSVKNKVDGQINESESSNKFESMSTHTSPQFPFHPKLMKQKRQKNKHKKAKKEGYVSKKDFK